MYSNTYIHTYIHTYTSITRYLPCHLVPCAFAVLVPPSPAYPSSYIHTVHSALLSSCRLHTDCQFQAQFIPSLALIPNQGCRRRCASLSANPATLLLPPSQPSATSLHHIHPSHFLHRTLRTSHFAPCTSHLAPRTSHLAPRTSYLIPHTSYLIPHTPACAVLLGPLSSVCPLRRAHHCLPTPSAQYTHSPVRRSSAEGDLCLRYG
ncbi:hypothetical protein K504DRAFT_463787 [Pleomassaria siparia CBS 279.74]|uniref:Uncharacterized protein n=1 Tax=Pleomassaria siparia CBS 279.74 TaxID=1314801 RepID=A0A6G1JRI4_9PLEO|nr:hypothetical protein K504DRAFT_463787 [Pleomassaria siparia CBS 279.74]